MQMRGDVNEPTGSAIFYTPIISEEWNYRAILGFDAMRMFERDERILPYQNIFNLNPLESEIILFYSFFDDEVDLITVDDGECDIFANKNEKYMTSNLLAVDGILAKGLKKYMDNYFDMIRGSLDNSEKINRDPIPENFNLDDVLPDWYNQ